MNESYDNMIERRAREHQFGEERCPCGWRLAESCHPERGDCEEAADE